MGSIDELFATLRRIDGRGYKAYKDIRGAYRADGYELHVEHVQGDPFADPSRVRVVLPPESAGLPAWAYESRARRVACADFLNREFADALAEFSSPTGSGKGGELRVLTPGQAVLERSSLRVGEDGLVEARFQVGLPARGRRVMGGAAARMFAEDVEDAVHDALRMEALDEAALRRHLEVVDDTRALRDQLAPRGMVAFVADGAVLPRESGTSDRPLGQGAVVFRAPESLAITLEVPFAGEVRGLGVPEGVFLIVGGGFHGKSTLLRGLEQGVYDHVPGDGRERVVAVEGAAKVRAEDGRAVTGTDISNFLDGLPGGQDTRAFTTRNASGSTSQAAAIAEALEAGATALLLDEDTSATNLLIRDARMQALVAAADEPITPMIDRVRALHQEGGVSTVLVCGGSGDYLDVADHVLAMREYVPVDVTAKAREVAAARPAEREAAPSAWRVTGARVVERGCIRAGRGRRERVIKTPTDDRLVFGVEEVPLAGLEQLVEVAQARALGHAIAWAGAQAVDGDRTVTEILDRVMEELEARGLEAFPARATGRLARFRRLELGALLSRLRGLAVSPAGS
jgi:predicted ABC-class ATPase